MTSIIADKMKNIKPSATLAITSKAAEMKSQGIDIISLGAGEPDFTTPNFVKEATIQAINNNKTKYTNVEGILPLKDAIIAKLAKDNNITYDKSEIMVSCGAKHAIFNLLFVSLNDGDEVIIPAPYWVSYPDMVVLAGGKPVIVNCSSEQNFKISAKQLDDAITSNTKWLILNSPNNPTGSVYSKEELQDIAQILHKHPQVHVISDDIYEKILYDGTKFYNLAQVDPSLKSRIALINGVSKSHSMTGYRIGYVATDAPLIKAMSKLQSQSTSNPCSIAQEASVEGFETR